MASFVQVDNYESGTIHYTQSDGEELGNNEAFFQNNQDFLNSLYSTTETAGYGKRYIHEHLGASPWVTVILSSFVFLIMFVLCIWYIFWVMKWRRMRRQPIHFKKE